MNYYFLVISFIFSINIFSQNKKNNISVDLLGAYSFFDVFQKNDDDSFSSERFSDYRGKISFAFEIDYQKSINNKNNLFFKTGFSIINYGYYSEKRNIDLTTFEGNQLIIFDRILLQKISTNEKYLQLPIGVQYCFFAKNKFSAYSELSLGLLYYLETSESYYIKLESGYESSNNSVFFNRGVYPLALNGRSSIGCRYQISDKFSFSTLMHYNRLLTSSYKSVSLYIFYYNIGGSIRLEYWF